MAKQTPPWRGHRKTTSAVLVTILERTAQRHAVFSDDDRVLVSVCEFWAAARTGTLREHLGDVAAFRIHALPVRYRKVLDHSYEGPKSVRN